MCENLNIISTRWIATLFVISYDNWLALREPYYLNSPVPVGCSYDIELVIFNDRYLISFETALRHKDTTDD